MVKIILAPGALMIINHHNININNFTIIITVIENINVMNGYYFLNLELCKF